jgi:hypothetical protein
MQEQDLSAMLEGTGASWCYVYAQKGKARRDRANRQGLTSTNDVQMDYQRCTEETRDV